MQNKTKALVPSFRSYYEMKPTQTYPNIQGQKKKDVTLIRHLVPHIRNWKYLGLPTEKPHEPSEFK